MLAGRNPTLVYRRIDFDARVSGANPRELLAVCYEQLIGSLGSALLAQERRDNAMKSQALTRALSALTALQMGVSGDGPVADALLHMYTAARRAVLDGVLNFDPVVISQVRQDFIDIAESISRA
ncbi:flagellin [Novosphingobium sp. FSY-8]|uniref:Flagellin n=1 Tax=Novosphingobium ovatum TaxID=1908523 RepID=A0ABW9XG58_9SPHN|nr:flagellar protein FliS [Novosphingobium ovatum]NBC37524.1 flagellin [Novosphingobium ovatum]